MLKQLSITGSCLRPRVIPWKNEQICLNNFTTAQIDPMTHWRGPDPQVGNHWCEEQRWKTALNVNRRQVTIRWWEHMSGCDLMNSSASIEGEKEVWGYFVCMTQCGCVISTHSEKQQLKYFPSKFKKTPLQSHQITEKTWHQWHKLTANSLSAVYKRTSPLNKYIYWVTRY